MISKLIDQFPPILYSEYYDRLFVVLNIPVSSSKYLTALAAIILLALVLSFISEYFLLLGLLVTIAGLLYPIFLYRKTIHEIRSELPKFILDIGSGMLLGLNVLESIRLAMNDTNSIAKYFKPYMNRLEIGKESINEVFISFANRFRDRKIQIAVFQLINSISTGSPKELKHLGMQLLREQMLDMKEFSNKLQILSQFYMVILLLFPVYTILVTIMSLASEQPIPNIIPIFTVLLPMILLMFIYIISLIFPSNYLIQQSSDPSPLLLNWFVMIIAFYFQIEILWLALLYTLVSIIYVYYNFHNIQNMELQKELERDLLEVSLILSSLPRFDMNMFLKRVKDAGLGKWSDISSRTLKMLNSGVSIREIFDYLYKLPSGYVKVFIKNLEYIYYSGISSHDRMNEWLDMFVNMLNLRKEMEAELSTFKYTIIISFIILPIIYSSLYNFAKEMVNIELEILMYLPVIVVGSGVAMLSNIYRSPYWIIQLSLYTMLSLIIVSLKS
ncbi:MAG: hypothetical protein QXU27_01285 [Candidatus Anstonellales archaeon]